MAGGRPTKLTPEAIEQAIHYINGGYEDKGDIIPSAVGLAETLDVATKTLYNWGDASDEFLHILEKCNQRQHRILVNQGLKGDINPTICKLVLGKHGYHERQEHTGASGGAMKFESTLLEVVGVKASDDTSS